MKLPSLILQPIVENAIKFGLYDTIGDITISIVTKSANGQLEIVVRNPFDPVNAQPRHGTGFGLNSIRRRPVGSLASTAAPAPSPNRHALTSTPGSLSK